MLEDYRDRQSIEFKSAERFTPSKLTVPTSLGAWRVLAIMIAASVMMNSTGCNFRNWAVRDAILVSYRDAVWAKRAYNLRYGNCDRPYSDHFEAGFCAGYSETCNGGDGYVPAMPPTTYRGFEYQSAEGVQCVNAWFEGYPAGVAAARKENMGNYNNVLTSKMINSAIAQEKATNILPSKIPVVNKTSKLSNAPERQANRNAQTFLNSQNTSTPVGQPPISSEAGTRMASPAASNELKKNHLNASSANRSQTSVVGSGVATKSLDFESLDEDLRIEVPLQTSKPTTSPPSTPIKNRILTPIESIPK